MLPKHQQMIDEVLNFAENDNRIVGLAVGGSYITKNMDEFSDLDFVIVTSEESYEPVMKDRFSIVENFGELLSAFTGEHVGEPRVIISLFNSPLLHVDFKFVSIKDVSKRVENPVILYEFNECLTKAFSSEEAKYPVPDLQWIEDRFWVWVHYAAAKIGRGEYFEVIDFTSYLRQTVLSPLILMKKCKLPRGVRYIEVDAPEYIGALNKTVAISEVNSCINAVKSSIKLYAELREFHASKDFVKRVNAEKAAIGYFDKIINRVGQSKTATIKNRDCR